jgi:hypothetical protein
VNVTFHTLTSISAAAVLSSRGAGKKSRPTSFHDSVLVLTGGFLGGVLLHGLLDYLPHSYPIPSVLDAIFSLALFVIAIALAQPHHRLLVAACFLGAVFPDLVDLGPAIVNKNLGWSVPVVKLFPWHWRQYSGSIYDESRNFVSLFWHLAIVGVSVSLLFGYRRTLFAVGSERQTQ